LFLWYLSSTNRQLGSQSIPVLIPKISSTG
jgi:hypothetical protein